MDEFLSEKEVAARLGVSAASIWRLRRRGIGPEYSMVGGRIIYRWADVERWFEGHKPRRSAPRRLKAI